MTKILIVVFHESGLNRGIFGNNNMPINCITFHSIIIGIDFGTMGAYDDFPIMKKLLTALIFHQFFEGNSLGLMFSDIKEKFSLTSIIIFTVFFSMQVSVGVIIGMIIINDFQTGTTYNKISHLYSTSCMNAFAAGILIYIGLVEMIAEEFSKITVTSNPILKACMILGFLLGLSCMSIIGIWA